VQQHQRRTFDAALVRSSGISPWHAQTF
jgi:hypothetical protein